MKRILCVITLLILPSFAFAQDGEFPKFKVNVLVTTAEEDISSTINSFLRREFRSLNDVEIDEAEPFWELLIVAQKVWAGGAAVGVAFSIVIVEPFWSEELLLYVRPENKTYVEGRTSGLRILKNQYVQVGGEEHIKRICEEIVAADVGRFDLNAK